MSIHCHSCNWDQDDCYSDSYNPAKYLATWNEDLFGAKSDEIDKPFPGDCQWIKENGNLTNRQVIAREYEKFSKRILNMKWVTYEQFNKDPNKICPKCGAKNLDVD